MEFKIIDLGEGNYQFIYKGIGRDWSTGEEIEIEGSVETHSIEELETQIETLQADIDRRQAMANAINDFASKKTGDYKSFNWTK